MKLLITKSAFCIAFCLFICSVQSFGQSAMEKRANKLYENYAYSQAIELYEYVIAKKPGNNAVIRNLADAYRKTNNPEKSVEWFSKVIAAGIAKNEDYLFYAQALAGIGKKDEAKMQFEKYDKLMAIDKRGARSIKDIQNFPDFFNESDAYKIQNLNSNTTKSDFSPAFNGDNSLIVVSNGYHKSFAKSIFPWNDQQWLDLYDVSLVNDSSTGSSQKLSRNINSKYHEGPLSITKDNSLMAFTRNSFYKGKVKRSSDHINKLKLFFAQKENGEWNNVTPFPFNSDEYSCGHPSFSKDGNTLYFSSDMPGGFGASDIYKSKFENNTWSKPENLGPVINSEGNELFPFIQNDSLLLFASNGWGGMGGLDIFRSEVKNGIFTKIENIGAPVNSISDDFGIIVKNNGKSGYFSSNREGGKGEDDVYRFTFTARPTPLIIVDQDEVKPVGLAKVTVFQNDVLVGSQTADAEGKTKFMLKPCLTYKVESSAEGYPDRKQTVTTACPASKSEEIRVLMKKPKLYVNVFDKYLNKDLAGAELLLEDITANATPTSTTGVTDEKGYFKFVLTPCHEYKITATKKGLPVVSKTVKAPCTEKEDDAAVKLGTGIAPIKGVLVKIKVVDEQSGEVVPNAKIKLFNKATKELQQLITDENGIYETVLTENTNVNASASRIGYFSTSKSKSDIEVKKGDKEITKELKVLKLREGGVIALEGIFYDLAKWNIRPDAGKVLDYVVLVMQENPSMVIELGSHTDAQGKDDANLKLSDARAKSAAEYIIAHGIDATRITGKGYGESQIKNKCGNGVKCPDKLHQENRRTEIRIVDFE
jgi:outer membrane protein OmpA-like peptidoglycan-associated protein/tetratricopeptide (TPR) repeat protein